MQAAHREGVAGVFGRATSAVVDNAKKKNRRRRRRPRRIRRSKECHDGVHKEDGRVLHVRRKTMLQLQKKQASRKKTRHHAPFSLEVFGEHEGGEADFAFVHDGDGEDHARGAEGDAGVEAGDAALLVEEGGGLELGLVHFVLEVALDARLDGVERVRADGGDDAGADGAEDLGEGALGDAGLLDVLLEDRDHAENACGVQAFAAARHHGAAA
mmetsp:Transcript_17091/g.51907  ORF Transcript_17091/g.51907 Transcript_17091/m.51907 type:complete len:213 (+) Transcript_17091:592-1230(+)